MNSFSTSAFVTLIFLLVFGFTASFAQHPDQTPLNNPGYEPEDGLFYRVTIPLETSETIRQVGDLGVAIDHVHFHENALQAELSGYELKLLREAGIPFGIHTRDMAAWYEAELTSDPVFQGGLPRLQGVPENFKLGSMGGHLTFDEVVAELDLMHELYPELITPKFSIGQSYEGRPIWTVWIASDLETPKPQAYYNSLIHAREPMSMMNLVYYMWWLLENYGEDDYATFLVDNRHMAFSLVLNPDGYEFNRMNNPNGGGMHRKNRRPVGTSNQGVDLNRNFGPMIFWDHPSGGSSTNPNTDTYRGEAPFSEPETEAMRTFTLSHDFRTVFNYHNFSNLLIYPYGSLNRETADSLTFRAYAAEMTAENNYVYGTDMETVGYATRGAADDWFYGLESSGGFGPSYNRISMTPEVGGANDGGSGWGGAFWARAERIVPLSQDNLLPNQLLAQFAGPELRLTENANLMLSNIDAPIGEEASFFFTVSGFENFGRSNMNLTFSVETDAGFITFLNDTSEHHLAYGESFAGLTDFFVFETAADAVPGTSFEITVTAGAPLSATSYSWDYTFTTTGQPVSSESGPELPRSLVLHQNYPNPFNPATTLFFGLPDAAEVNLRVYDSTGRLVQTLIEGRQYSAGEHRVSFDASRLPSGIYLYRLEASGQTLTRRMTLIK
ncbi:Por secretion system C-terminal sorting domain-containing protein [Cyclonatronum proteinivorum]|uniref:carboxypeptidase T n=1 Tax=Cyclonatronum proteinivorum TaxID=1457365 RepID=A0A345UM51_9BACT|nr:M14 family zinc carboxypeptidase [Cyclonatronum proteinivorum]AXJ01553.1 Por secretion system C-terminal sorting domain-containing protein [Cyclonatronum proteinivorum]